MKINYVHDGINLRKVRKIWEMSGGTVSDRRRTGEEVFSHPLVERPIVVNKRRKDSPRKLSATLRRLLAA